MKIARILNIIAVIFFAVSVLLLEGLAIYISIGLVVASMIYWRISANRTGRDLTKQNRDGQTD